MKIEVINIVDQDDGGAIVTVDMDGAMVRAMVKIGLLKVLIDSANAVIEEHGETEVSE